MQCVIFALNRYLELCIHGKLWTLSFPSCRFSAVIVTWPKQITIQLHLQNKLNFSHFTLDFAITSVLQLQKCTFVSQSQHLMELEAAAKIMGSSSRRTAVYYLSTKLIPWHGKMLTLYYSSGLKL